MYFRSRAQQRRFCLQILCGFAAIFAGSFLLGKLSNTAHIVSDVVSSALLRQQRRNVRSWRFSHLFPEPKTVAPRTTKETVTVYLARERRESPAYSIFKTDVLQRYGSGRIQWLIRENSECDQDCKVGYGESMLRHEPCLAVAPPRKAQPKGACLQEHLKCNYPVCKTMVVNDQMCDNIDVPYDARQYFTTERADFGYLPVGPRYDAWLALQRIREGHQFFIAPPSKRRYSFNAVFSRNANLMRQKLAVAIEHQGTTKRLPIFTAMSKFVGKHQKAPSDADVLNDQLNSDDYVRVLLDSIFTLAPAGDSPECFRLFEAVEAGSIPVMSRDDLYNTRHPNPGNRKDLKDTEHPCRKALLHWYGAPILVLDSWSDLYPTVDGLMKDPEALDDMQANLHVWYEDYMQRAVSKFEDFMIGSSTARIKN